jgi:hypothetical protein
MKILHPRDGGAGWTSSFNLLQDGQGPSENSGHQTFRRSVHHAHSLGLSLAPDP